jgi:sRNA-binding regulator protein Hfq
MNKQNEDFEMTRTTLTLKPKGVKEPTPPKEKKVISKRVPYSEQADGLDLLVVQYIKEKTEIKFTFLDDTRMIGKITDRDKYGFRIDMGDGRNTTIFKHSLKFYQEIR